MGRLQLLVLDHQELVFPHLVAATLVVGLHHLAGDGIDHLLAQAVPCHPVYLPERYTF
jgi:hypothetical protein